MVDSYRNALKKPVKDSNQTKETSGNEESGKLKNAKPQDIVRLYDIIAQVIFNTY